jgi:hypothetical protein
MLFEDFDTNDSVAAISKSWPINSEKLRIRVVRILNFSDIQNIFDRDSCARFMKKNFNSI